MTKTIKTCTPELLLLCLTYIFAAALEYWLVNWIKAEGVNLPIFFAIIQNAAWPLQLYFYYLELKKLSSPRIITFNMWRSYFILGGLASFITMTRMVGLSTLPPSLYVICANTETVFETIMTRTILKRPVRMLQWTATALVVGGVAVALYDPSSGKYGAGGGGDSSSHERNSILFGVILSVSSRWASALNVILAEKLLGKDAKSKVGVSECATANAIIPFCLVPFVLTVVPEYKSWGHTLYPLPKTATIIIVILLVSLSLAKNFDRAAKFGIVTASSTIFFAGIDAFMKVVAGIGSFLFFGEQISWSSYIGFILVVLALICLFLDKRNHMNAIKHEIDVNRKISEVRRSEQRSKSSVTESDIGEIVIFDADIFDDDTEVLWPIEELDDNGEENENQSQVERLLSRSPMSDLGSINSDGKRSRSRDGVVYNALLSDEHKI